MKKVLIVILIICFIFNSGCSKSINTSNKFESKNITNEENEDNSYFFSGNVIAPNYKGSFLFDEVIEKDVKLQLDEVGNLRHGKLYELKIDPIKSIPNDRLNLGYFYVLNDKIYKIELTEENLSKLKTDEEVPEGSMIVCQDEELKDTLSGDEPGWHQFIEVNGTTREYHSYNNLVETGYYESFTWEKNKGLINYRSGFGAERDSIELELISD